LSGFVAFLIAVVLLVPAILVAMPVHEMGHAAAAYFLGDKSVRYFGYFTINPRRFIDPLGALSVLVILTGWGRRVPVQPNRISTPFQHVVHELGGPVANLVVAIALGLLYRALGGLGLPTTFGSIGVGIIGAVLYAIIFLNLSIFAFQLLPVPGLDGWGVIEGLFRNRYSHFFYQVNSRRREIQAGAFLLVVLYGLLQHSSLLSRVRSPFFQPASLISIGSCAIYVIPNLAVLYPCLL
jgi:Zn-dependent protease